MSVESTQLRKSAVRGFEGIPVIDCDVHTDPGVGLFPFLSEKTQRYLGLIGMRAFPLKGAATGNGVFRLDTIPPDGLPGTDPEFAREQLLDEYGLTAAVINSINLGTGAMPVNLQVELARAVNDYNETWLESDDRWLSSILTSMVDPRAGVAEVLRCREKSSRYMQILLDTHTERPAGNEMYWPIYEVACGLGIPVAFHFVGRGKPLETGLGQATYYYELRTGLDVYAQSLACSMIFEGVFDRWPDLKVALIETDWTWAVPMAWRLDASWSVMREELPDLQRAPSEYLREHFWFSTQPGVETEHPDQIYEAFEQLDRGGLGDKLMFATDYPHWDMDNPFEWTPRGLSHEAKWRILSGNAAALYGIELPQVKQP